MFLSEGVMCVSSCIADLVIIDLTWRIKTQRSAERETKCMALETNPLVDNI